MFTKFREKLKQALSLFSRKAQEEAEPIKEGAEIRKEAPAPAEQTGQTLKQPPQRPEPHIPSTPKQEPEAPPAPARPRTAPSPQEQAAPTKTEEPAEEASAPPKQPLFRRIFAKRGQPAAAPQEAPVSVQQKETEPPASPAAPPGVPQPPRGIFTKAKELLTTRRLSGEKFEELFGNLELALLENNVAVEVVHRLRADLKERLVDKPLPRDLEAVVEEALKRSLDDVLSVPSLDMLAEAKAKKPFVIAFFGINGSGKTTTIAKVAALLQKHGLSCVLAAADTFRAAAIHQLEEHAVKLDAKLIKHDYGADAAAVAFDAVQFARKNRHDVVLIDTAGRLHSDANLMDELKKVVRVAKPDLKIFVGESITGNDCIEQTQRFDELVGIDAIILTKADVDEKGGTALSISYVTKKPIVFIGTGQRYEDLQPFTKELVLENLGLGA